MQTFEEYLASLLQSRMDSKVKDAMMYALLNGGKRIRPQLLFAVLKSYGQTIQKGMTTAAAIEMIHTYSLIHDDLPAMDDDTLRRGKPTCHVAFDEATAILAGDALLTLAFELIVTQPFDAKTCLGIAKECAIASGMEGMILGQTRDLEGENKQYFKESELQQIHLYKTGKLLSLPLICGSLLSGHSDDIETWRNIGTSIGLAFQIQDDVLDVTSNEETFGKNIGSDIANHKSTYVSIMGIETAKEKANALLQDARNLWDQLNIHKEPMEEIFKNLIHRSR